MKRTILLVLTVTLLVGSWQASAAQAAKPAAQKKATSGKSVKPAETTKAAEASTPVETATVASPVAEPTPVADSVISDTTHHKKGLFGKAKSVMGNKVVKAVMKTAACTMVPGGQAIAGAIDAASSKSAGEAASGAAGVATGTSCMPGMGGMGGAGMAGASMAGAGMGGRGGLAGIAGAGLANAAAASAYSPAENATAQAGNGYAMAGGMGMMPDPKPMADCLGLTVEEYNALMLPTHGEARPVTKAETKRMQQISKKVPPQRQVSCNQTVGMRQSNAQMAQMQAVTGQPVSLVEDLAGDLKKGKTAVRGIDWVSGSAELSPAGRAAFDQAMAKLGQAMKESGQHYRLDLYLDKSADDAAASTLGAVRLQTVQSTLAAVIGDPAAAPQIGKAKRDKNPRLELVKVK